MDTVIEWWGSWHPLLRFITFPIVSALSLISIVLSIPEIYRVAKHKRPSREIKNLTRDELREWSERLCGRFDSLCEQNPDALDVLAEPTDATKRLRDLLRDEAVSAGSVAECANDLCLQFKDWKGIPVAELVWLARHAECWANNKRRRTSG
jgi:hypothetical protein